ncbi:MAG: hypothetical protein ABL949_12330 [Fimbriimonadaceae bacterium]
MSRSLHLWLPIIASCFTATSVADWTVTYLDRNEGTYILAANGLHHAGQDNPTPGVFHAALWRDASNSYVDLHPTGASRSGINGMDGFQQVGAAAFLGQAHAGLWTGTAASFVDLHPPGAVSSRALGVHNGTQVGSSNDEVGERACLWNGTPESWVDLHRFGTGSSVAHCVEGTTQAGYATILVPNWGLKKHASFWSGTANSWVDIHPSDLPYSNSWIWSLDGGVASGAVEVNGAAHASIWTGNPAQRRDLHPDLPGFVTVDESWIVDSAGGNQAGMVVAGSILRAGYWSGTRESYTNLHDMLPSQYAAGGSDVYAIATDGDNDYVYGRGYNMVTLRADHIKWTRLRPGSFRLDLSRTSVAGDTSVRGTLVLGEPNTENTLFTVYDSSSLVSSPATVTVPAGATSKAFRIRVKAVTSPLSATVFVRHGTRVRSASLVLQALIPSAISLSSYRVAGGQSIVGRLFLNGVAGPGGRVVSLLENSAYAEVARTVTVPAGASTTTFEISTRRVPTIQSVSVTARVSAGESARSFLLVP